MVRSRGWAATLRHARGAIFPGRDLTYDEWIARYDRLSPTDVAAIRARDETVAPRPRVVVFVVGAHPAISETMQSVADQIHVADAVHIDADAAALLAAPEDFAFVLMAGDRLGPHALALFAWALADDPRASLAFSDEDRLDHAGARADPYFKSDWNPALARAQDFLTGAAMLRMSLLREVVTQDAVAQKVSEDDWRRWMSIAASRAPEAAIVHIPHVLVHRRSVAPSVSAPDLTRGRVGPWPSVSVIVPTRDHADLLRVCLDGLQGETDYPALRILVADNDSVRPETRTLFDERRRTGVEVIATPGPFNFSRMNNRAVARATGDIVLFLNNDISIIEPSWLKHMIVWFDQADVGAVGAKLLYPDGTLQHGGVVLGLLGVAGHSHLAAPGDDPGAHDWLRLPRDVSCVTAACLAVRREVFLAVGGFDEAHLGVAFNDVDLCLRLRDAGHRIVWTPQARLVHHESKSRGSDRTGEKRLRFESEVEIMLRRWGPKLSRDPFFNPNLSLTSSRPSLASPPRVARPWRSERRQAKGG